MEEGYGGGYTVRREAIGIVGEKVAGGGEGGERFGVREYAFHITRLASLVIGGSMNCATAT